MSDLDPVLDLGQIDSMVWSISKLAAYGNVALVTSSTQDKITETYFLLKIYPHSVFN